MKVGNVVRAWRNSNGYIYGFITEVDPHPHPMNQPPVFYKVCWTTPSQPAPNSWLHLAEVEGWKWKLVAR